TPNMEKLAKRGLRFTNAYAMPLCSPTRASILTGKYPSRHGILTASGHQPPQPAGFKYLPDTAPATQALISPISKNFLEPSEFTLAEALREAGYRTAHIGKWHLGLTAEHRPNQQGFDVMFEAAPDPGPPSYFSPYGVSPEGKAGGKNRVGTITDGPPGEYIVDRQAEEAVKFIRANKDGPFFLNFWSYGVHGPWGHKEEYTEVFANKKDPSGRQGNAIMASMLKSVDDALGRVITELDELKLTGKTVFIFFSDNGGNTHSNMPDDRKTAGKAKSQKSPQLTDWRKWAGDLPPTSNAPLRDGKGTLYEGGTRVPLMIMWPGVVPSGAESAALTHAVDLYPTILDLAGLKAKDGQIIDGISIAPVLREPKAALPRETIFNYFPMGRPSRPGGVWVRQGDWKLIRWFETGPDQPSIHELYDLTKDIGESRNLSAQMPAKVKALDALIDGFLKDTQALLPKANPAYSGPKDAPPARPLGGWAPKGCTAEEMGGALVVTGDGRAPFLGNAGLNHAGPVRLSLKANGEGGSARVQWRTTAQETFPTDGQTLEFALAANGETHVEIPVAGVLKHIRLYFPAQNHPFTLEWVEMKSTKAGAQPQRWNFDGPSK
ncbi:MAG TPA: sulfatase, partial [Prosthecobacter sp.]|nr:sulfatase [Prosthecobacter sp.]